jgi:NAD(P)H-hydrate epimerase
MRALTRAEIRNYDKTAIARGVPGIVLMENAGRGATDVLVSLGVHGSVGIVCGKGNNGGDGFVMARQLHDRGIDVEIELAVSLHDITGDAEVMFRALTGLNISVRFFEGDTQALTRRLANHSWIAEALLGTGLQGAVRSPYTEMISAINESGSKVLALDIPSGLDCDTGQPLGNAVRAHHTVTFVAPKVGMLAPSAAHYVGVIHVVQIGAG